MTKETGTPQIRFSGYNDTWEQRKVSELCSISTGKSNTQDKVEDGEYPFYVRSPIIERSTKYLYDEEAVLTVGDGVGTGKVFHYVNGKYDLHQRCYRMYDFTDELNAHYFYHTFSKLFYKRVMAMTAKTSVDSVRLEMIADMEIPCPDIKEQVQIGAYFDNLDHLITLHQRKYDKLVKVKKSMLEKMFPREGAKVPEIRFYGFTDDWEQRKLGEISDLITKGTTPKDKSGTGEVNFIKVENINPDNGEITNTSQISMEEHEGYLKRSQLKENDILFSIAGTLGRVSTVKSSILPANTNQALSIIRLKEGVIEYVTTVLKGKVVEDFIKRNPTVGAQPNLSLEQVNGLEIPFPNKEEQKEIGDYFRNLDHLITLHQRKLEKLKNLKKACLKKMFI